MIFSLSQDSKLAFPRLQAESCHWLEVLGNEQAQDFKSSPSTGFSIYFRGMFFDTASRFLMFISGPVRAGEDEKAKEGEAPGVGDELDGASFAINAISIRLLKQDHRFSGAD